MAPVSMLGLPSVLDRTIFTNRGPIVKRPLPLLSGTNLRVLSENVVEIPTASFTDSDIGRTIEISGSANGRNDGTFLILEVLNSLRVKLEDVNFNVSDVALTTNAIVALSNALRTAFSAHLSSAIVVGTVVTNVHYVDDVFNIITTPVAYDLSTAITLINDIRSKYAAHITNFGGAFHDAPDLRNVTHYPAATGMESARLLANELRSKYMEHRLERLIHQMSDPNNYVSEGSVQTVTDVYPGLLTGPFTWTLYDPRYGEIADSPDDVDAYLNGSDATVEAVFGLLGAVVLQSKPIPTDTVTVDYDYIENPPVRFLSSNTFEYVMNQDGNNGICGLPGHNYRARSYVIDPSNTPDLISAFEPKRTQWKYKALERAYTASQNDPNLLLLNSPVTKVTYDVLNEFVAERTIRYDPTTLPQNASDPWELKGQGTFTLSASGDELTIEDSDSRITSMPPFFTHRMDVKADSQVSAAFRVLVETWLPDGVFTGVSFGLSDGDRVALAGFIQTKAIGLSSVMARANDFKAKFNAHLDESGVHNPNDEQNVIEIVDANDLESAIILLNHLREKFNAHVARGDSTGVTTDVHVIPDTVNAAVTPEATDLDTAIALANALANRYNNHRVEDGIHWTDDTLNAVDTVKQIGILTNSGFYELEDGWEGYSTDWTVLRTYRLYMSPNGDASMYVSGSVDPVLEVPAESLPTLSSLDAKFDPLQQTFFGSIISYGESVSKWSFIRVNVNPIDANLIGDNKSVEYDASFTPEESIVPWISVGQGGDEWTVSTGVSPVQYLILDSTCSLPTESFDLIGLSSGTYRGFLRFEPILSSKTTSTIEFRTSVDYHTFGIDNKSSGVFLDDGTFAVHFAFLYFFPVAATVTGSASIFSIAAGDKMSFRIDRRPTITVTFSASTSSIADVVNEINAEVGYSFASNSGGFLKLTSSTVGAASSIEIQSGIAAVKLGLGIGKHFGSDSTPEQRFAWYGTTLPDKEDPPWMESGGQSADLLERTLRITDSDSADHLSYVMNNPVSTETVITSSGDWRFGVRVTVQSYVAGNTLAGLDFAGTTVQVDEGPFGKNLYFQLCVDSNDDGYVHLLSYNPSTVSMDSVAQYPCAWNDGERHSYEVVANKVADLVLVFWDGALLTPVGPSPTYGGLNSGTGPRKSLTFGSGASPVGTYDMRSAQSTVDWESVWMFRDTKLNDPDAPLNRYVGLYKGGDPTVLSSWYLHQIDWSTRHTYRIVRSPLTAVSLYVDDADVPSISVNYDVLTFPQSFSSFLTDVTNGQSAVAFGSFNPQELSRTRWEYVRYSMGKLTLTDRIVPPHQVYNQGNAIASPEHLRTPAIHEHYAFKVYSGGTPLDDFMADEDVPAHTALGEGVPPVPMTQDMKSRGGLIKNVTPTADVDPLTFVNRNGYLGNFVDDTFNVVSEGVATDLATSEATVVTLANDLKARYDLHLVQPGVHVADDFVNGTTAPVAVDLTTAMALLNDVRTKYEAHRILATSHTPVDETNVVAAGAATDLSSAADLANALKSAYSGHLDSGRFHSTDDVVNVLTAAIATDRISAAVLADDLKLTLIDHATNVGGAFHPVMDPSPSGLGSIAGLVSGRVPTVLNRVEDCTLHVQVGDVVQFYTGPNVGSGSRVVSNVLSSTSFEVSVAFGALDAAESTIARVVGSVPQFQTGDMIQLANDLRDRFNAHLIKADVHDFNDSVNSVTSVPAYDVPSATVLLNELGTDYSIHRAGFVFHQAHDATNVVTAAAADNATSEAASLANALKSAFNAHVMEARSHVNLDPDNAITAVDVVSVATLIDLANALKAGYGTHRTATDRGSKMHVDDDLVNVVTAPDATDLSTAVDLVNDVRAQYEAHRVQAGVHGSSVFIRLDAPDRVLYDRMKFWVTEDDGREGLVASLSDDETLYLNGAVKNTDAKTFSYLGADLPERTALISDGADASTIVAGDTLVVEVDGALPTTITFEATDVTAALVAARINLQTWWLSSPLATDVGAEVRLMSPTTGVGSSVIVSGGTAREKLGLVVPQQAVWHVVSEDPTAVSVTHMGTFVRYGTTGVTTTAYRAATGVGNVPSSNFEVDITMRVNSTAGSGPTFDSGVYAGLGGLGGADGYSVAIGFEYDLGTQYVKVVDVKANATLYRAQFDWDDAAFHTYRLEYDATASAFSLVIVS